MRKRLYGLIIIFYVSTQFASAAIAEPSQEFVGIIPLITGIMGIEGDITGLLGFLATLAFMTFSVYLVFKVVFKSFSENVDFVSDRDLFGGSDGRNLVAILSVLFTIAGVFGAGALNIVGGFQQLIIAALGLGLLAFAGVVVLGGGGGALGILGVSTGTAAKMTAKGGKQVSEGLNEAYDIVNTAEEETADAEEEADEGHMEDAVKEFKDVMNLIERVEPRLGDGFTEIEEELKDARDKLATTGATEREDHQRFADIGNRLKRIRQFLKVIYEGPGSQKPLVVDVGNGNELNVTGSPSPTGEYAEGEFIAFLEGNLPVEDSSKGMYVRDEIDVEIPNEYGIDTALDDMERIEDDVKAINRNLDSLSGGLFDALGEFDEAVDNAMRTSLLLKELAKVLNRVEGDTETLEEIERERSLNDLVDDTRALVSEENKAEEVKDELEHYAEEIEEAVKQVIEPLEDELKRNETEIREAKEEIKLDEETREIIDNFGSAIGNSLGLGSSAKIDSTTLNEDNLKDDSNSAWQGYLKPLYDALATVESQLDSIESNLEDNDRRVVGEVKTILGDASENDEQIQIAENIAEEMQRIYGESRYT